MKWTIETGLVSREAADWIDGRYRGYLKGEVSELAICGEMVQMYQRLREDEMRRAAKVFFESRIERNIFPEMRALVEELRGKSVELWAVSSTNNWVIEEGVRGFGIPAERVLAARVAVKNGVVTDVIEDVPTDEGKVVALRRAGRDRSGCGFREFGARRGDAGDGAKSVSGESDAGAAGAERSGGMGGLLSGVG